MAEHKQRANRSNQLAQTAGPRAGRQDPKENAGRKGADIQQVRQAPDDSTSAAPAPARGEGAVFDDDSMFNSADRQAAVLAQEQAGKKGPKPKRKEARERTGRRKTA